jgi:hypothetical protein
MKNKLLLQQITAILKAPKRKKKFRPSISKQVLPQGFTLKLLEGRIMGL